MPTWLAVIEHVPRLTRVTLVTETVHTGKVVEVKVTVSVDDAVAVRVNVPGPNPTLLSGPNVMVCALRPMVKLCVTVAAAR